MENLIAVEDFTPHTPYPTTAPSFLNPVVQMLGENDAGLMPSGYDRVISNMRPHFPMTWPVEQHYAHDQSDHFCRQTEPPLYASGIGIP